MKNTSNLKLILELITLFVLMPIFFCFDFPIQIKLGFGIVGFIYILILLRRGRYLFFKKSFANYSKKMGLKFGLNLAILILISISYLEWTNPDTLFNVISKKPLMWLRFIALYSFLSVVPQEIIYRSFYFQRYKNLFPNNTVFIVSNAIVFSLGHIFFMNMIVSTITFIGGIFFAHTYNKTKSLTLVCIEHVLYGCWLYTVGFGEILGFPIP